MQNPALNPGLSYYPPVATATAPAQNVFDPSHIGRMIPGAGTTGPLPGVSTGVGGGMPGLNNGQGGDMFSPILQPGVGGHAAPGGAAGVPAGEPTEAEVQAMLQALMGPAMANGAAGAPNMAVPTGETIPETYGSMRLGPNGSVVEVSSGSKGLLGRLLNPKVLLAAAALGVGAFFAKNALAGEGKEAAVNAVKQAGSEIAEAAEQGAEKAVNAAQTTVS